MYVRVYENVRAGLASAEERQRRALTGPVYFTKHERTTASGRQVRTLPALVIPLRGRGRVQHPGDQQRPARKLIATFAGVPDAPVSCFELRLDGGRKGILAMSGRPCRRPKRQVADVELDGHNGKRSDRAVRIALPCKQRKSR